MQRRDLVNGPTEMAKRAGVEFDLAREGGSHSVYVIAGQRIAIPRHREIAEGTARGILADARAAIGEKG